MSHHHRLELDFLHNHRSSINKKVGSHFEVFMLGESPCFVVVDRGTKKSWIEESQQLHNNGSLEVRTVSFTYQSMKGKIGGGWLWFQVFLIFTPTWDDPIWRSDFSDGLKPPTSKLNMWGSWCSGLQDHWVVAFWCIGFILRVLYCHILSSFMFC